MSEVQVKRTQDIYLHLTAQHSKGCLWHSCNHISDGSLAMLPKNPSLKKSVMPHQQPREPVKPWTWTLFSKYSKSFLYQF